VNDRATLEIDGTIATLRLVRADARNAIDPGMVQALADAADGVAAADGVRALLIAADGPAFTVGGDLRHFTSRIDDLSVALDEMIEVFHRALLGLAQLDVPIVCAVNGAAAGGGLGLLWPADMVIAAEDAIFATGFARIALSGDGGGSWWLPRLVGLRRARELIVNGRVLSADEALEWGLVSRVVPAAELAGVAAAEAQRLANGPTLAYAEMRRLLHGTFERTLAKGLDAERDAMRRSGATADAREGIPAFVERREPRFGGG
jgi:2-(1,2-epoxy-1,2-dihydrophenyl)acetyl-CoA isomerase